MVLIVRTHTLLFELRTSMLYPLYVLFSSLKEQPRAKYTNTFRPSAPCSLYFYNKQGLNSKYRSSKRVQRTENREQNSLKAPYEGTAAVPSTGGTAYSISTLASINKEPNLGTTKEQRSARD
jgi:hypothetical protein